MSEAEVETMHDPSDTRDDAAVDAFPKLRGQIAQLEALLAQLPSRSRTDPALARLHERVVTALALVDLAAALLTRDDLGAPVQADAVDAQSTRTPGDA
jgi:hypothetical protein